MEGGLTDFAVGDGVGVAFFCTILDHAHMSFSMRQKGLWIIFCCDLDGMLHIVANKEGRFLANRRSAATSLGVEIVDHPCRS